jgi:S1-C subfamily serine protease
MKYLLVILIYCLSSLSCQANTHKENYKLYKDSIVLISTKKLGLDDEYGTGFAVLDGQYILTDYHIIEDAKQINILLNGEKIQYDKIIKTDKELDLALIRIKNKLKPIPLVSLISELGDEVTCISYGGGNDLSVTNGLVNRYIKFKGGTVIQTNTPISPGSSGAPLINQKGEVIGIVLGIISKPNFQAFNLACPLCDLKFLVPSIKD